MQLDLLWQYMQVDMDAERFEQEMRNSPNRQQLPARPAGQHGSHRG